MTDDKLLRIDMTVIVLIHRPVWAVSRVTGLSAFMLARIMVALTPGLLVVWWFSRFGGLDFFGFSAAAMWAVVCRMKLRDFSQEERVLRRQWAQGAMYLSIMGAHLRVVTLLAFLSLDIARFAIDFTTRFGGLRTALMLVSCFYTSLYGLALYVHLIPPGPPKRKREKRDWLAWLRRAPQPVPA